MSSYVEDQSHCETVSAVHTQPLTAEQDFHGSIEGLLKRKKKKKCVWMQQSHCLVTPYGTMDLFEKAYLKW